MNVKDFNNFVITKLEECQKVMGLKNLEYANDGDKLSNFKQTAVLKGETPEKALWGMWAKHIISIKKIIEDLDTGIAPSESLLAEKCIDMINYPLLLEALMMERRPQRVAGFK